MLSLCSLNHVAREVASTKESKFFYTTVLGFEEMPRPELGCPGAWLYHPQAKMMIHLIEPSDPSRDFVDIRAKRIAYNKTQLPLVGHLAFVSSDLERDAATLTSHGISFEKLQTSFGATQLFLIDPDGHAIEIADCAPKPGKTTCAKEEESAP